MIKEERPMFLKIFLIMLITLIAEAAAIFFASSKEFPIPRNLLLIQVPLILFILVFAYLKNRKIWLRKVGEYGINLKEVSRNSKTDLDALYTILKNKKELSVKSISNLFKIPEDLAMEWSRILESGELVTIDYPGFGSPKIIYIEPKKKAVSLNKKKKKAIKKSQKKGIKEVIKKEVIKGAVKEEKERGQ